MDPPETTDPLESAALTIALKSSFEALHAADFPLGNQLGAIVSVNSLSMSTQEAAVRVSSSYDDDADGFLLSVFGDLLESALVDKLAPELAKKLSPYGLINRLLVEQMNFLLTGVIYPSLGFDYVKLHEVSFTSEYLITIVTPVSPAPSGGGSIPTPLTRICTDPPLPGARAALLEPAAGPLVYDVETGPDGCGPIPLPPGTYRIQIIADGFDPIGFTAPVGDSGGIIVVPIADEPLFNVTVATAGTGTGTVIANPPGPDYPAGTVVTLTATPDQGSTFEGWSGAYSGTGDCMVSMDSDKTVSATFGLQVLPTFTLTIKIGGSGRGTVISDPPGPRYAAGTVVTLTANPDPGSGFAGWTGECEGEGAGDCVITMDADRTVTATFESLPGGLDLFIFPGQGTQGCFDTFTEESTVNPVTLVAFGGSPFSGYTWTKTTGSVLPPGVALEPLTGILRSSGGRVVERNYQFSVTVSDGSITASENVSVETSEASSGTVDGIPGIGCPRAIFHQSSLATIQLPNARPGVSYGASLFVAGGVSPLSWTLAGGNLPPGLMIDAARGVVRGVPFSSIPPQHDFRVHD